VSSALVLARGYWSLPAVDTSQERTSAFASYHPEAAIPLPAQLRHCRAASECLRCAIPAVLAEASPRSSELRETALAHTIGNKAEAVFRRGDALEKSRAMMEAWAQRCEPKSAANVLAFAKPVSA
jgi:hypothetical protein